MKSSFDFEIHSSRFVTTRRRSKIRLWFLLILSLITYLNNLPLKNKLLKPSLYRINNFSGLGMRL